MTIRKAVPAWLTMRLIFEAGKVRRGTRGPPAMRYCSNERTAMLARLEADIGEQDRLAALVADREAKTAVPPRPPAAPAPCRRCVRVEAALRKLLTEFG